MALDVFHAWPRDALVGVADRFLLKLRDRNIENEAALRPKGPGPGSSLSSLLSLSATICLPGDLASHLPPRCRSSHLHLPGRVYEREVCVDPSQLLASEANRRYLEEERRFNSTTPKAFLEFIGFYAPWRKTQARRGAARSLQHATRSGC